MDQITPFAFANFRNQNRKFGIKTDDRRRHMYIIGKTGMGKSVLIENLVYSDILNGNGACLVDPHGDSAELIVNSIPSNRINDVIYLNPADLENPIAFNVLEKVDPKYRHLVASGLVGVFKKIWADSWGPRLEYILRNTILALLDYPDSTLLGVNRMLVDKEYRKKVVAKVQDPVVKMYWESEFTKYNEKFLTEAIAPIQNKIGQFLSTSLIRNIVGQVKSSIDLREIMDESKILILNLSKGRIGEDSSALLGAMIITKIQLAAMSRVDIPEKDRKDFYLYVDEFQNFATESFANILSEARKYHLCLTVGHQYIGQLEVSGNTVVRDAVFGNVGTMIVFRVGAADAEFLSREFTPRYTEEDLVNLPKYSVYIKLMIDGVASDPFSAGTLPPISKKTSSEERVVRATRERYGQSREEVEEKIARWSGVETEAMMEKLEKELEDKRFGKIVEKKHDFLSAMRGDFIKEEEKEVQELEVAKEAKATESGRSGDSERREVREEDLHVVECDSCSVKTKINFKPDPSRPVFCKDCLKDYRKKQALEENLRGRRSENRGSGPSALEQKMRNDKNRRLSEQKKPAPVSASPTKPSAPANPPQTPRVPASGPSLSLSDLSGSKPTSFKGNKQ
ncbi:type IV secretion system DNA-binding domain-containing protein [Candidatus Falkowbacteria bacterium]|jgi:CxxC-x17-CxxC domain-containing protein|nr:type IV secretion system DNA-binding domain-containing protein [Candidatus Falkowbacteria bacterium]MBT5503260.1 type IV secretion system DNA-binding domain-containing protein [Candidatus Falkowbacteria bacterium]MBT6574259.1 type IV secretion system DNA-binding domain-containing protein [Candidatus Falkowbacteria bacterium]MBT7348163.1 type IV secretion system DNA-binding domain-containing protein [Candidatus Falkowbacteria bacterium]MBT7500776.1 type IV secretion system DNA-binding domain-